MDTKFDKIPMKEPRNRHDIDEGKIKSILLSFRRSQSIETFDAMAQHQFRSLLVPTIVGSRPDSTRDPSVQAHATDGADASSLIVHRLPFRLSRTVHQNTGTAADRLIGRQIAGTDQSTDPTSRATDQQSDRPASHPDGRPNSQPRKRLLPNCLVLPQLQLLQLFQKLQLLQLIWKLELLQLFQKLQLPQLFLLPPRLSDLQVKARDVSEDDHRRAEKHVGAQLEEPEGGLAYAELKRHHRPEVEHSQERTGADGEGILVVRLEPIVKCPV